MTRHSKEKREWKSILEELGLGGVEARDDAVGTEQSGGGVRHRLLLRHRFRQQAQRKALYVSKGERKQYSREGDVRGEGRDADKGEGEGEKGEDEARKLDR